jgi:hypothetical protein
MGKEKLMEPSAIVDLKAFVPARDYELAKQFYLDLGFTLNWSSNEISEFQIGSFGRRQPETPKQKETLDARLPHPGRSYL